MMHHLGWLLREAIIIRWMNRRDTLELNIIYVSIFDVMNKLQKAIKFESTHLLVKTCLWLAGAWRFAECALV